MTAVIHHGPPGSYKTFSIVQNVLIEALQLGRLVITNIRGFDSVDKVKSGLQLDLPDKAQIWYLEPNDEGFQSMATFFHWAPAGALIAMDEGQRIYPTRNRRFDDLDLQSDIPLLDVDDQPLINIETQQVIFRPKTVEIAFDQHRHYNWDIYISTPNISKIHKEIRHVVEWAYRHRNNTGLLPWYKNTWTEFRHDAENNGKSINHYSGSPKRYKAIAKYFSCYQSTATGVAKASNENISIFRDSRLRFVFIVIVICVSYLVYSLHAAFNRVKAKTDQSSPAPVAQIVSQSSSVSDSLFSDVDTRKIMPAASVDPLKDSSIFYMGKINNQLLFEVNIPSVSDQPLPFTYDDLRHLGYFIKYQSSAFIALEHLGKIVYAFAKPNAGPSQRAGEPVEQQRAGVGLASPLLSSSAIIDQGDSRN